MTRKEPIVRFDPMKPVLLATGAMVLILGTPAYRFVRDSLGAAPAAATSGPAPDVQHRNSVGYWTDPLPPDHVQVAADEAKPEFEIETIPLKERGRCSLRFRVREKNGLRVDGIQVELRHLVRDAATGELRPDAHFRPMVHFFRKPLDAGRICEEDETLMPHEVAQLWDGSLGTRENWTTNVISYVRLARKTRPGDTSPRATIARERA